MGSSNTNHRPINHEQLCSAVFQNIPQRSKAFQQNEKSKTNPNSPGKLDPRAFLSQAVDQAVGDALPDELLQRAVEPSACSTVCQGVPQHSKAFHDSEKSKTNPTVPDTREPSGELTPRHQVAARLLMQGLKPAAIATQLQTTRQTINRWRHLPAMIKELNRLHDLLARTAPIRADPAPPAARSTSTKPAPQPQAEEIDRWQILEQYGFKRPAKP